MKKKLINVSHYLLLKEHKKYLGLKKVKLFKFKIKSDVYLKKQRTFFSDNSTVHFFILRLYKAFAFLIKFAFLFSFKWEEFHWKKNVILQLKLPINNKISEINDDDNDEISELSSNFASHKGTCQWHDSGVFVC